MNPRYNEQISPVPWHFVKSRFYCIVSLWVVFSLNEARRAGRGTLTPARPGRLRGRLLSPAKSLRFLFLWKAVPSHEHSTFTFSVWMAVPGHEHINLLFLFWTAVVGQERIIFPFSVLNDSYRPWTYCFSFFRFEWQFPAVNKSILLLLLFYFIFIFIS